MKNSVLKCLLRMKNFLGILFENNKVTYIKLNPENDKQVRFMFDTRSNPEVAKWLVGNPPIDYQKHMNYLKNLPNTTSYYIMYIGKQPIGYYSYKYSHDWDADFDRIVEVGFVIIPEFQGKGFGKQMVKDCISGIDKSKYKIVLSVDVRNVKAIHIYEDIGFKLTEVGDKYSWFSLKKD